MTDRSRRSPLARPVLAAAMLIAVLAVAALPARAQTSPYTEHTDRPIKALSAEQVEGLLAGSGLGLALPAELNGYPGPRHVLDLADELELSGEQRAEVTKIYEEMETKARQLGRETVDAEARLDALFASGEITPQALRTTLDELGDLHAALRHAHLEAHLSTKALLSEAQVRRYDDLRGYAHGQDGHGMHHPGGHPAGGHPAEGHPRQGHEPEGHRPEEHRPDAHDGGHEG